MAAIFSDSVLWLICSVWLLSLSGLKSVLFLPPSRRKKSWLWGLDPSGLLAVDCQVFPVSVPFLFQEYVYFVSQPDCVFLVFSFYILVLLSFLRRKKKGFSFIECMWVLPACMYVHLVYVVSVEARGGHWSPWNRQLPTVT